MASEYVPNGYILIARKIKKSSLWKALSAKQKVIMIELLLQAQFEDGEVVRNGEIIYLKRGQIATSYSLLQKHLGPEFSIKTIRGAIEKLEKYDFTAKDRAKARAKKGLLLTIVNYDVYQDPKKYKGKANGKERGKEGAKQGAIYKECTKELNKNYINAVWEYYKDKMEALGLKRKKTDVKTSHINARLDDGFTVEQLKQVVDSVFTDEYMLGNNDRGKQYLEIDNFLRNTEKVEKWLMRKSPRRQGLGDL